MSLEDLSPMSSDRTLPQAHAHRVRRGHDRRAHSRRGRGVDGFRADTLADNPRWFSKKKGCETLEEMEGRTTFAI